MRCDGSPDPTILPEINMYMSLWREDRLHADIESILKESDLVLQVGNHLFILIFLKFKDCLNITSDNFSDVFRY